MTWRVQVRHHQVKDAEEVLAAAAPAALQKALRCPDCGSRRASYPQMTRKFLLPTVMLHLGIIFRLLDHECYCEHCHHIWNPPTEDVGAVPKPATHFPFSAWR